MNRRELSLTRLDNNIVFPFFHHWAETSQTDYRCPPALFLLEVAFFDLSMKFFIQTKMMDDLKLKTRDSHTSTKCRRSTQDVNVLEVTKTIKMSLKSVNSLTLVCWLQVLWEELINNNNYNLLFNVDTRKKWLPVDFTEGGKP